MGAEIDRTPAPNSPRLDNIGPKLVKNGQSWSKSAPNLVEIGKFARVRPRFGRNNFARKRTNVDRDRPKLAKVEPQLADV